MGEKKKFYCLTVKYNSRKIDKIYRLDEQIIHNLEEQYKYLFPNADLSIKEEWI